MLEERPSWFSPVAYPPAQPLFSAKLPPRKPKNLDRRTREYLTSQEVQQLIAAARNTGRYGQRDALLLLMMYRHALRVAEVVDLRWEQVSLDEGKLHVNRLKNGDPSIHFLEGDEIRALRRLRKEHPDVAFLFWSERQAPLTCRSVHAVVARAGQVAGLPFSVHPHMLRHAKGYQLAAKGVDTRAIQAYLGHRNIQHTVTYTQLDPSRFKGFGKD
jgi:type 1 fimbriae regulatory protein FimE